METEEDNSEDQQEDKIELEMSWSDKTRTTRNTKTSLRMVQRNYNTRSFANVINREGEDGAQDHIRMF